MCWILPDFGRKVVEDSDEKIIRKSHWSMNSWLITCAMQLVHNPAQFDVILTENMFGDILSDEDKLLVTGSIVGFLLQV